MSGERVLGEMCDLGLAATEAGPDGFLPGDPERLRVLLAAKRMQLASGFTPLVLHREEARWRGALDAVARRFRAAGAGLVVLAAASGSGDYDARPRLSEDEWSRLLRALDAARAVASAHGLEVALHPHYGTMVETPDEIARVIDGCSIPLCLDTGHIVLGGGDPVAVAERAPDRVAHLHLKDADAALAARVRAGEVAFSDAVAGGVFLPLGDGDIDVVAMLDRVRAAGYDGWYVLEQDVKLATEPPPGAGPCQDAARSLAFLRRALAT
jgi:inosose dehydratase